MKPSILHPILRFSSLGFALSLLAGCAAISASQATSDTYELAATNVQSSQSVRRGAQILITEPTALKALDSENIVIETAPLTIQYLDEARWSDRLPRVIQQKLASAFESSNRFGGVGLPGQGLAID
ncbi:MAG: ABC-type transport auxiliary lipoprotein family protein, partial [Pseudomonadota bacterium]